MGPAQLNAKGNPRLISDMSTGLNKASNEAVSLMGRNFSGAQAQAVTLANSGNQALMEKFDSSFEVHLAARRPNADNVTKLFVNETGRNGVVAYDASRLAALQNGAESGALANDLTRQNGYCFHFWCGLYEPTSERSDGYCKAETEPDGKIRI